jgi:hypothetical protein
MSARDEISKAAENAMEDLARSSEPPDRQNQTTTGMYPTPEGLASPSK